MDELRGLAGHQVGAPSGGPGGQDHPPLLARLGTFFFRYRPAVLPLVFLPLVLVLVPRSPSWVGGPGRLLDLVGLCVALTGQALRAAVIGLAYIRRGGQQGQAFADDLVTEGLFRHVRNPLYLGNILIALGLMIVFNNPWAYVIGVPFVLLFYASIVAAEEAYLRSRFGRVFEDYCRRVGRWVPDLRGLRQTLRGTRFDWRRLIVKEYGSAYAWTACAVLLLAREALLDGDLSRRTSALRALAVALGLLTIGWATARFLKKSRRLRPARASTPRADRAAAVASGISGPIPETMGGSAWREGGAGRTPQAVDDLRRIRAQIDALDREFMDCLARRAALSRRAATTKIELGQAVRDPSREAAFLRERRAWAQESGLDADSVEAIFEAILRFSRTVQEAAGWSASEEISRSDDGRGRLRRGPPPA